MAKQKRGWFSTDGRPGDRTLEQQLLGLDLLLSSCRGKTILDAGAAEGLISIELARRGALAVHGIEIVPEHVEVGRKLKGDLPVTFEVGDLNVWQPRRKYDVVIALAILQKVKDPTALAMTLADAARELIVLRLPPAVAPNVLDPRSGNILHRVGSTIEARGLKLTHTDRGEFNEFVGYWERR